MSSSQERFKQRLKSYARTPGSFIVMLLVVLSAVLTFTVLIFLIVYILIHGIPYIKPSLLSRCRIPSGREVLAWARENCGRCVESFFHPRCQAFSPG